MLNLHKLTCILLYQLFNKLQMLNYNFPKKYNTLYNFCATFPSSCAIHGRSRLSQDRGLRLKIPDKEPLRECSVHKKYVPELSSNAKKNGMHPLHNPFLLSVSLFFYSGFRGTTTASPSLLEGP